MKDENGMPLPFDGTFWSITHKTHYVGGVVAPTPIGIDIERIRDLSHGLFQKTASEREWALAEHGEKIIIDIFPFLDVKRSRAKGNRHRN